MAFVFRAACRCSVRLILSVVARKRKSNARRFMTMWYGHKIGTAWPLWWHVFFFPRGIAQRLLITVEEIRRVVRLLVSSLRNIFSARRIHHAYCSSVERVRSLQIASGVWSDDKAIGIRPRFEILIENDLETRSYKSEIVVRRSFVIRARYHYLIRAIQKRECWCFSVLFWPMADALRALRVVLVKYTQHFII